MRYVIVQGNLCDGYKLYGTYETFDEADEASNGAEVWIMELNSLELAEIEL